jgi:AAA domain, putative AbiEii toxin, Type IV TA system
LDRRREIDESIEAAQRHVTTTLQQLVAHWHTKLERRQSIARVADLQSRIDAIARRLAEEGASPESLAIIADAPRFARGRNYLGQVNIRLNAEFQRIQQGMANVLAIPMDQFSDVDTFPELATLSAAVDVSRGEALDHFNEILASFRTLQIAYEQALASFIDKEQAFNAAHAQAVATQTAHRSLLDENNRLTAELSAAAERESELAARETGTADTVAQFAEARSKLKELLAERFTVLHDAAEQVAQKSSALLKARAKHDPCPASYVASLGALLERSYVQDVEVKCSTWIRDAIAASPENAWDVICNDILAAYEAKIMAGQPPEAPDALTTDLAGFLSVSEKQAGRIYLNLNDTVVGTIVSAAPGDYIVMTYLDDGGSIDFAKASPGQQASALLELLLRQSAGTLIIDQPEDDLDNRIIMKIVDLMRDAKNKRQLIFSTHNPNIVVNGDADKVIALKSSDPSGRPGDDSVRIQLFDDGAIETTAVRDAITHIMEGGQAAFDLRSRKYRFVSNR